MGTTAEKLTYLNGTKTAIKNVLNLAGANITTEPFRQYATSWQERLLYFMNNGTQEVWDNWDKVNGSGTSVSLNNTEEAPMSLTYKGNTQQSGTPTPDSPQDIHVVSGDNSIEVVGKNLLNTSLMKEFTPNSTTWYSLDGIDGFYNATQIAKSNLYYNIISGQTYTLSVYSTKNLSTSANNPIQLVNESGNVISSIAKNTTSITFTASTSGRAYPRMSVNSASTLTQCLLQLEKGSTATSYEPYQGASYPISLSSKNLFDGNWINGQISSSNGTLLDSTGVRSSSNFIQIEPNTTYTISRSTDVSTIPLRYYNGVKTYLTYAQGITSGKSATFTTPNNAYYMKFVDWSNASENVMLEKGSTVSTYQPYNPNPIELCKIGTYQDKIDKSSGKNLFDKDTITTTTGWLIEDGTISTNHPDYYVSDFIPVKPNTAYYKTKTDSARTKFYDSNKQPLNTTSYQDISIGGNAGTFTTSNNAYYLRMTINTSLSSLNSIMLNEGTTALPYEPYGTDWYLKKEIGKVVFNGSESTYNVEDLGSGSYRIGCANFIADNPSIQYTYNLETGYCNYFKYLMQYSGNLSTQRVYTTANNIYFITSVASTENDFKTWLSTHNTTIYYPLSTPTYTKIEGTLASQLEEAKKSYESQTNISQTNNDLPFELDVVALGEIA